jgi:nucleotide-binding universal stress UspA family protein
MSDLESESINVVFCAVDFSETASLALAHASQLARRHDAGLVLAHVVEPLPVVSYPILMVPLDAEIELREFASARLEELAETVRQSGLTVSTGLEHGPPGPHLIEMAERAGADIVVIGTRGLTGFEHLVLGSTAEYVVRRSQCPVLTVHPGDDSPKDPVKLVIVPTDLGPKAAEAVDAFARIFAGDDRPCVLLAFADPTPPYLEPFKHETLEKWGQPDVRKEDIEEKLAPTIAKFEGAGFQVETEILDGGPVQAITELAKERDADMILMSTHGRSALANVLVGRTAQRIVQHAPCLVLTIRSSKKEAAVDAVNAANADEG